MKRVLVATFMQETGSFNPMLSRYEDFNILRGDEILNAFRGTGASTGGTLEVLAERDDIEIVPTYAAWMGTTGGPVGSADLAYNLRTP